VATAFPVWCHLSKRYPKAGSLKHKLIIRALILFKL
jgi:hypothetical protein